MQVQWTKIRIQRTRTQAHWIRIRLFLNTERHDNIPSWIYFPSETAKFSILGFQKEKLPHCQNMKFPFFSSPWGLFLPSRIRKTTDYPTESRFVIQSGPGSKTITGEQSEYLINHTHPHLWEKELNGKNRGDTSNSIKLFWTVTVISSETPTSNIKNPSSSF